MTRLSDYVGSSLGVNLGSTPDTTRVTVTNSGGTDATILDATDLRAGVMTQAQVIKLNSLGATNLGTSTATNFTKITSSTGSDTFIYPADNAKAGVMSRDQAVKLDSIPDSDLIVRRDTTQYIYGAKRFVGGGLITIFGIESLPGIIFRGMTITDGYIFLAGLPTAADSTKIWKDAQGFLRIG